MLRALRLLDNCQGSLVMPFGLSVFALCHQEARQISEYLFFGETYIHYRMLFFVILHLSNNSIYLSNGNLNCKNPKEAHAYALPHPLSCDKDIPDLCCISDK